jgi:hypothetical protein
VALNLLECVLVWWELTLVCSDWMPPMTLPMVTIASPGAATRDVGSPLALVCCCCCACFSALSTCPPAGLVFPESNFPATDLDFYAGHVAVHPPLQSPPLQTPNKRSSLKHVAAVFAFSTRGYDVYLHINPLHPRIFPRFMVAHLV